MRKTPDGGGPIYPSYNDGKIKNVPKMHEAVIDVSS
jgi:hypothetical protein